MQANFHIMRREPATLPAHRRNMSEQNGSSAETAEKCTSCRTGQQVSGSLPGRTGFFRSAVLQIFLQPRQQFLQMSLYCPHLFPADLPFRDHQDFAWRYSPFLSQQPECFPQNPADSVADDCPFMKTPAADDPAARCLISVRCYG